MRLLTILALLVILISCKEKESPLTAQSIVDQSIAVSCQGNCEHAVIDFIFRGKAYKSIRDGGAYSMERLANDSLGRVRDVISNNGFQRFMNDTLVQVADSMVTKYSNSVNSVHYFAQLPFGLNAPAVKKELLGETTIKGEPYFEIGVSFNQEGGGTDFEDRFVYWIHKKEYTVDYLAYSYDTDDKGIRFREAFNPRVVNGIRFVDYNNYKTDDLSTPLTDLDTLFEAGSLKLLSKIETENVNVNVFVQ